MGKRYLNNKKQKRDKIINSKSEIILIIIIITIIGGGLYYFKNIKNLNLVSDEKTNVSKNEVIIEDIQIQEKKSEPLKKQIIMSVAGDVTLGTDTKFAYESSLPAAFINNGRSYSYFMQNVSDIFKKDDYTIVNLETTLTDSNNKAKKDGDIFYNFKGPKEYVNILSEASIDGVTVANNHIYDYGNQGFKDTINILQEKKVDICGEGNKILKDLQGVKVGFLGYTAWEDSNNIKNQIIKDINELRKQGAQIIIPYFHWGIERSYYPYDVQENLARFTIDNGADIVIGSHPHVIQSMENYKGKLIVYSMGNFCFGGNSNPSDKRTIILQLKANIENDKFINFEYKIIPTMISSRNDKNDYIPTVATDQNRENILKTLNELSPTLNGKIKDEYFYIE